MRVSDHHRESRTSKATDFEDVGSPQVVHAILASCMIARLETDTLRRVIANSALGILASGFVLLLCDFIAVDAAPNAH